MEKKPDKKPTAKKTKKTTKKIVAKRSYKKAIKVVEPTVPVIIPPKIIDTFTSFELPSKLDEMDEYFNKHKLKLTERVVAVIEFGIEHKLDVVEAFQFKGTNFVVTISKENFLENLKNIYEYYIQTEQYEYCLKIKTLESKLLSNESKEK